MVVFPVQFGFVPLVFYWNSFGGSNSLSSGAQSEKSLPMVLYSVPNSPFYYSAQGSSLYVSDGISCPSNTDVGI
jgi:hypothetical protein